MLVQPKLRTAEQKSRKMLNEEKMIIDLELAIKKAQFRNAQKTKSESYEMPMGDNGRQMALVSAHGTNGKISSILNSFLSLIT